MIQNAKTPSTDKQVLQEFLILLVLLNAGLNLHAEFFSY